MTTKPTALLFLRRSVASPSEQAVADRLEAEGYKVRYLNASRWAGEREAADVIYTHRPDVAAAHEGLEVRSYAPPPKPKPVPKPKPAPAKKKAATKKTAAKKTRKRR